MSTRAWAVVPAKCPSRAKSRLRGVLGDDDRARFARALLEHVLGVLSGVPSLEGVLVATDCEEVGRIARAFGASSRHDGAAGSLAAVVDQALAEVAGRGADRALVFMADLPDLAAVDVADLLAACRTDDVVVVRDREGLHTNALALRPPTAMLTCVGRPDSFDAHCRAARAAGLRLRVLENERIAFDVDGPADHARLASRAPSGAGPGVQAPPPATERRNLKRSSRASSA
jgi:2-phospho-L-lactate guanylyltransferase